MTLILEQFYLPKFIEQVLYNLKRMYPSKIWMQRKTAVNVDTSSGIKVNTIQSWYFKDAISLPQKVEEFPNSGTPQPLGGNSINTQAVEFILDKKNCKGYIPLQEDFLMLFGKRYIVIKVLENYMNGLAYYLKATSEVNDSNNLVFDSIVTDTLELVNGS